MLIFGIQYIAVCFLECDIVFYLIVDDDSIVIWLWFCGVVLIIIIGINCDSG